MSYHLNSGMFQGPPPLETYLREDMFQSHSNIYPLNNNTYQSHPDMWASPPIRAEKAKPIEISEARQKSQQALKLIQATKEARLQGPLPLEGPSFTKGLQRYIDDNRNRIIEEINQIIRSAVNNGAVSASWSDVYISDTDVVYQGYLRVISEEYPEFKITTDNYYD
jgi:hypothetical protein